MEVLSPMTRLYESAAGDSDTIKQVQSDTEDDMPDVVVLATWADASLRPIGKYVQGYQKLYPKASILVIESRTYDIAFKPWSSIHQSLITALDVVRTAVRSKKRILLHSFSNGGAVMAIQLANQFRLKEGIPLPIRAQIIDSAPGLATIKSGVAIAAASAPKGIMRPVHVGVFYVLCLVVYIWSHYLNQGDVLSRMRVALLDKEILPGERRICYVYSKTDKIIDSKDVEEHIAEAKGDRFDVEVAVFEGSAHVQHLLVDSARYWRCIQRTWERA
ncbi:MAG: hypothetical protein M1820_008704 [Bogoriella megaspora]|nr:MAG: hypothetical protein M1820_008704 [Bogoriella megaspora]